MASASPRRRRRTRQVAEEGVCEEERGGEGVGPGVCFGCGGAVFVAVVCCGQRGKVGRGAVGVQEIWVVVLVWCLALCWLEGVEVVGGGAAFAGAVGVE